MGLSMAEKKALTREVSKRYQKAGRKEKTRILDELVDTTGYNRKYILHVLATWGKTTTVRLGGTAVRLKAEPGKRRKGGGRKPRYQGKDFTAALKAVWVFFWYKCGKILAPLMRQQMDHLTAYGPFRITAEVRELLLTVSPSTIDRLLKPEKKRLACTGKSGTKPGNLLKRQIPVRTYYPDADKKPGFLEIDTVHHNGGAESGEYCLTLTATCVYSGWVELRSLLNKAHKWVLEALPAVQSSLPVPLLGLDSDNGSEFINSALVSWCADRQVQFTRSRAYHKNDNCFVEQKNGAVVRNYLPYDRFSSPAERDALATVYRSLCPLLNFFIPAQRLISKTRVGSKVKKVYDEPQSPYQRLLASPDVSPQDKADLARRYRLYNPVLLQQEVHGAVAALRRLNRRPALQAREALASSALAVF